MSIEYIFDINNVKEKYEIDKVAKQANGSVLLTSGRSVLLATVTMDEEAIIDGDFVPLTVQYVEKAYAGNKIPGGFIKREQKPGEFEVLTSRIIDRSLRPLFNKSHTYNTVINVILLSADEKSDLQALALRVASMALYISNIPVDKIVYGIRVGKIDGEIIINPNMQDLSKSTLDLFISGSDDEILMIEMMSKSNTSIDDDDSVVHHMNEVSEEELIFIMQIAKDHISNATTEYKNKVKSNKEPLNLIYESKDIDNNLIDIINNKYTDKLKDAISHMATSERSSKLKDISREILENDINEQSIATKDILKALEHVKKKIVRQNIVDEGKRPDGRGFKDIRNIDIETNILPNAHSSCLFTRGQTQALSVLTIGSEKDSQMYESITSKQPLYDSLMLHYNFPAFSVGEAYPLSPPGRREIGHGNLAKKAILGSIQDIKGKSIRIVSEILESNGSSSMATVCASSIALKAAKIKTDKLVAGIAMGLIAQDNKIAILSDITGIEDHDGDMDFKIAGSIDGITALQMDLKINGIDLSILKDAFIQAKEGREHILQIMQKSCENIDFNDDILPSENSFFVPSEKVVFVIGQGGKIIKEIIKEFNVNIDIDRDSGEIRVSSSSEKDVENATKYIQNIVQSQENVVRVQYKSGDKLNGKVKKITDFGAFVGLPSGDDGLLHISKISNERISRVEDKLQVGDEIEVVVLSVENRKISLAHKDYTMQ